MIQLSKTIRLASVWVLLTLLAACSQLRVDQLRVEYRENPTTVDALHPVLLGE